MPVTKSKFFAKYDLPGNTQRPDSIEAEGRIRYLNDEITFVGDEAADDEVLLLPLPKGAFVDLTKSYIIGVAMTGVTVDVDTNAGTTILTSALSLATAGSRVFDADANGLVEVTDGRLALTVAGGSPGAVTQRVSVAYYIR